MKSYLCKMVNSVKKNIRELSLADLENYIQELGDKRFRAKQIYEWLWQKHAHTFDAMNTMLLSFLPYTSSACR